MCIRDRTNKDFLYIDKKKNEQDAEAVLREMGIKVDVKSSLENLNVSVKQFIEIAREISNKNLKVLFLDEPTASLNKEDTDIFMKIIKALKEKGISIIFISHRLDEITELCDEVTVFRDGEVVANHQKDEFDAVSYTHLDVYKRQL